MAAASGCRPFPGAIEERGPTSCSTASASASASALEQAAAALAACSQHARQSHVPLDTCRSTWAAIGG